MAVFTEPNEYPFKEGSLFLGAFSQGGIAYPVGIKTERHAITIAGAGAGKGVGVIIPNLKLWPNSVLVIDPKGEAAEETVKDREAMGQKTHVIDPFNSSRVDDRFRASYNPIEHLDIESMTIKEDIEMISDGIIMRPDPSASHWDDGAQAIISGLIAYALLTLPKKEQNLIEVRAILRNVDRFDAVAEEMKNLSGCGGLCEAGASAIYAKEGGYFVSNAEKNTRWLDSEGMKNALTKSTFSLSDIKQKNTSVFLVLPANYLTQHGRFLRLFVRCAIEEMMRKTPSGDLKGTECLFLLDEFFALGFINEIAVSAGLMRGYGLKMWVVLQDIGQLVKLYGREGADTFFGNSDVHQFFGNMDAATLDYISARLGNTSMEDMPMRPVYEKYFSADLGNSRSKVQDEAHDTFRAMDQQMHEMDMTAYNETVSRSLGKPRLSAEAVAKAVKKEKSAVADGQITFVFGLKPLFLNIMPYFEFSRVAWDTPVPPPPALKEVRKSRLETFKERKNGGTENWWVIISCIVLLLSLVVGYFTGEMSKIIGGILLFWLFSWVIGWFR